MTDQQQWRAQAACRPGSGHDPDLWYPDPTDHATRRLAQRICQHDCPVRAECLGEANRRGEVWGVWGGLERNVRGGPAKPVGRPPSTGTGCGTPRGFKVHLQHDEKPCQPCRDAANEAYAEKYAKSLGGRSR